MTVKTFGLACLGAFVVTYLLTGLWHLVLLGDFYAAQSAALARPEPNMIAIAVGHLILALLMAWVYPIGYKGGSPVKEGLRFGAVIGLIWILPWSVIIYGIWNLPLAVVLVDSAWHVVEEGLAGLAVGLIYGPNLGRG